MLLSLVGTKRETMIMFKTMILSTLCTYFCLLVEQAFFQLCELRMNICSCLSLKFTTHCGRAHRGENYFPYLPNMQHHT